VVLLSDWICNICVCILVIDSEGTCKFYTGVVTVNFFRYCCSWLDIYI